MPPEVRDELRDVQPYNRGDAARFDPLWVLHSLDIIDKHRRLYVVGAALVGSRFNVGVLRDAELTYQEPFLGAVKDGDEVGRFTLKITGDDPSVQVHPEFTFGITLSEGLPQLPEVVGQDLPRFLSGLLNSTASTVARFERFFT